MRHEGRGPPAAGSWAGGPAAARRSLRDIPAPPDHPRGHSGDELRLDVHPTPADLRNSGNLSFQLRPDGTIVPRNKSGHLSDKTGTYGDHIHRVDLRILRRFRLYGRSTVEGSLEVFNVFNHANYGSYVTSEVSPLYGQPQQNFNVAYLPRMLQLGFRVAF